MSIDALVDFKISYLFGNSSSGLIHLHLDLLEPWLECWSLEMEALEVLWFVGSLFSDSLEGN